MVRVSDPALSNWNHSPRQLEPPSVGCFPRVSLCQGRVPAFLLKAFKLHRRIGRSSALLGHYYPRNGGQSFGRWSTERRLVLLPSMIFLPGRASGVILFLFFLISMGRAFWGTRNWYRGLVCVDAVELEIKSTSRHQGTGRVGCARQLRGDTPCGLISQASRPGLWILG